MTVDIARLESNSLVALDSANEALDRLGRWVEAAGHANRLVAPLVNTAFVPDSYRPKVDPRATPEVKAEAHAVAVANATAAVLQGITLGLDPMTALQQIYIVHGRPGMYTKMMVALVQAHGHEVWTEDLSDTRAVVAGRRRGTDYIERVTITMDMARRAKWTTNAKYQETPQDMLWSRAAARVCDRIASDVLKGVASVEGIRDEVAEQTGTRTIAAPRKRAAATVERPALPQAEEPPLDPEPAPADEPQPEPDNAVEMVTQAQHRKMHALWRKLGYEGEANRDNRLAIASKILGSAIESTAELTRDDATRLIDALVARERALAADNSVAAEPELEPEGGDA